MVEVRVLRDWSDNKPLVLQYESLAEGLAVAETFRGVGFWARTYVMREDGGCESFWGVDGGRKPAGRKG